MRKKKKDKRKILHRLSQMQVRDMMENKLRAKTIPSGKIYNRKKGDDYGSAS